MSLSTSELTAVTDTGIVFCPACGKRVTLPKVIEVGDTVSCPSCRALLLIDDLDPPAVIPSDENPDDDDELWDDDLDLEIVDHLTSAKDDESESMIEDSFDEDDDSDEDEELDDLDRLQFRRSLTRSPRRPRTPGTEDAPLEEVYMTQEGIDRLRNELNRLRDHKRPSLIAWFGETMAEGIEDEDIAEIEAARNELSWVNERIRSLETLLYSAVPLLKPTNNEIVQLGSIVTICEAECTEPETYRIVSSAEADPTNGSISDRSPLGKSLLGLGVGNHVTIQSPEGPIQFRITAVN
jgi:transcription elongation factor GreA